MSIIDELLRKAVEEGRLANLPGEGKPLVWDENPYTPDNMRMAYKVLKDNDLEPEWVMMGKELDAKREQVLSSLRRGWRLYQGELQDAGRDPVRGAQRKLKADAAWKLAQDNLREAAETLNKFILGYNLKVPQGIAHKIMVDIEREILRLGTS